MKRNSFLLLLLYSLCINAQQLIPNKSDSFIFPVFDMKVTPFSYSGSRLVIDKPEKSETHRVMIRTIRYSAHEANYYEIALFDKENEVTYRATARPWVLELESVNGKAQVIFLDNNTLFFKAQNLSVKLIPASNTAWINQLTPGEVKLVQRASLICHHFKASENQSLIIGTCPQIKGNNRDFKGITSTGTFAFREEPMEKLWNEELPDFDKTLILRKKEFDQWMTKMPAVQEKYSKSASLAWFIFWNVQAEPSGLITRRALLDGKTSWINQKWNWGDALQTLALANADLKLAFDQFMILFDNQQANGNVADCLNDQSIIFAYKKPPAYGFALKMLVQKYGWETCMPYLKEVYVPFGKWLEYWMTFCDLDHDGLASYNHGNDTGWDNCTILDQIGPIEGADLSAYIYISAKMLSGIAERTGDVKGAAKWKTFSENQLKTLINKNVVNNRFVSRSERDSTYIPSQSLINYTALIIGKDLPENIADAMVSDLQLGKGFMTPYGLASENTNSPKYLPAGYWRGPVWASPNYMIFTSLLELGETKLARTLAQRYCDNMNNNPEFAENFDALTGKSQSVPGLPWTASAYLLMANWLKENE